MSDREFLQSMKIKPDCCEECGRLIDDMGCEHILTLKKLERTMKDLGISPRPQPWWLAGLPGY